MFIASTFPRVRPSSRGAAWCDWRRAYRRASATKKHAAPPELGPINRTVTINMALLAELSSRTLKFD